MSIQRQKSPVFFFGLQLDLAGLAFHLSWLFLFLYSATPAGLENSDLQLGNSFSPLYLFSSLAVIITLLAFVMFRRRLERLLQTRSLTLFGIAATCVGTGAYYAALLMFPESAFAVAQLSGVLTGIGSGIIAMRWAWDFGGVPSATIMASAPSILAVTVACSVTVPHLPPALVACVVTLLPLASGLFALSVARTSDEDEQVVATPGAPLAENDNGSSHQPIATTPAPESSRAVSRAQFYGLLCGGIALLGLTLGITGQSGTSLFSLDSVTIFLGSAAGAIFVGSGLAMRHNSAASLSANLVVPVIVIVCFMVILASTQPARITQNFEAVGNLCLEMLFFAVLVVAARRFSMNAISVFAAGRVTYALSNMAGSELTGLLTAGASTDSIAQLSSFALLMGVEVIMVAAVIVVVLPRSGRNPQQNPGIPAPPSAGASLENMAGVTAVNAESNTESELIADTGMATPENRLSTPPHPGHAPFQERVAAFSEEYSLTAREAEVAKQLLMGHSYSRVMQELCIAEGTVNYHARNIYAKAGVHSRQELLQLFENGQ